MADSTSFFQKILLRLRSYAHDSRLCYDMVWMGFRVFNPTLASSSIKWWRENHKRHAGRRGFVIGNGPSLKIADLDRLRGEVCIASNKIYLAYPQTEWRPDYVTCSDKIVWEKIQPDLPGRVAQIFFLSTMDPALASVPGVVFRHRGSFRADRQGFSLDSAEGQYGGRTVTYHNLQMAVHLGLNPIYLIGCDHYYQGEAGTDQRGVAIEHQGANNHFVPNYRQPGEKVNNAPIGEMTAAYEHAARVCAEKGIAVYNATRGGHLEAFPRCAFDEVIPII